MAKKGEVSASEVFVICDVVENKVWLTRDPDGVPDDVGRVGDDGLLASLDFGPASPPLQLVYSNYTLTAGDVVYALQIDTLQDTIHRTLCRNSARVWILSERPTVRETAEDILRKVQSFYENTTLTVGVCEEEYRIASGDSSWIRWPPIVNENNETVGWFNLTKLTK